MKAPLYLGSALAGGPPPSFTTGAPTPSPYGDFIAPDPTKVAADPYYQFRFGEGNKAIQRSAAAHGTLLSGGTLKALDSFGSGLASEEGQHAFDRAMAVYGTNRDTNAQNFGQSLASFRGNLDAFGANTNAALGYGRLALDASGASSPGEATGGYGPTPGSGGAAPTWDATGYWNGRPKSQPATWYTRPKYASPTSGGAY
jgi:hypothetical protein